jgi:nucleotide-binding universal stress UspA family protein
MRPDFTRHNPCLCTGEKVAVNISEGGRAMKILLAVEGSPFSEAAAKSVACRPWPQNSEVKIITVIEPSQPYVAEPWALPTGYWDELEKSAQQQANQAIDRATREFNGTPGLAISNEILKGSPKAAILDEAETWGADLIVVGSHGYTGLQRMLLGSVSHAVMAHAPCSVEIVRSHEASQNVAQ